MKNLFLFIAFILFSSCYTSKTGYIDYRERRMYDWDPIYYVPNYIDPFFYRREPITIYRHTPVPRQPQQPRVYNNKSNTPPPSSNLKKESAPIRTFPKKDDNK